MTWLITTVLQWLGGGVLDRVLTHFEARANSETERLRIRTLRDQHAMTTSAGVVTAGMAYPFFWIPWLMATMPLAFWFGWGMLDTTFNGALPDVAEIPPGLLPWAQIAWANLFYSGAGVAGATIIGQAIAKR